jgi:DNA polymerase I-like protein with 3'-5' exonuclease and polymerase domains
MSEKVYKHFRKPLLGIIRKAERRGIMVDRQRLDYVTEMLEERKEMLTERAKVLAADENFNIGSQMQAGEFIFG